MGLLFGNDSQGNTEIDLGCGSLVHTTSYIGDAEIEMDWPHSDEVCSCVQAMPWRIADEVSIHSASQLIVAVLLRSISFDYRPL